MNFFKRNFLSLVVRLTCRLTSTNKLMDRLQQIHFDEAVEHAVVELKQQLLTNGKGNSALARKMWNLLNEGTLNFVQTQHVCKYNLY